MVVGIVLSLYPWSCCLFLDFLLTLGFVVMVITCLFHEYCSDGDEGLQIIPCLWGWCGRWGL